MWYVYLPPSVSQLLSAYSSLVHRWLYDNPGILHRDLSFNNIMYRLVEEEGKPKVYGVLTDYDLSSWTKSLKPDYTRTSQQRTGTPPYMAQELLLGESPVHLYRHDVESLFYIMLLMASRHTIRTPKGEKEPRVLMRSSAELPHQEWFDQQDYRALGQAKYHFLLKRPAIELSPDFKDFRPWLKSIQHYFSTGFKARPSRVDDEDLPWITGPAVVQYDDETLGGNIKYDKILEAIPHLGGALKGLAIRDPQHSPAPAASTSTGAA